MNGFRVGIIDTNYLTSGKNIDVARIILEPSTTATPDPVDTAWVPQLGDKITAQGAFSGMRTGWLRMQP